MSGADEDWLLGGAVRLRQADQPLKATVDAVLLAAYAPARSGDRVLDVGSGVGTVALCLAARVDGVRIDGVDVQAPLCAAATLNAELNGWSDRLAFHEMDIAFPNAAFASGYDGVVTNPPYLSAVAADPPRDAARRLSMVEGSVDWPAWAA
ncbi:MAG: methyltransferase, partial [Pseudomonadota bacterium]